MRGGVRLAEARVEIRKPITMKSLARLFSSGVIFCGAALTGSVQADEMLVADCLGHRRPNVFGGSRIDQRYLLFHIGGAVKRSHHEKGPENTIGYAE